MDTIEEIRKLKALLDQGAITTEEFSELKKKVLFKETYSTETQETTTISPKQTGSKSEVINSSTEVHNENKIIPSQVVTTEKSTGEVFGIPVWIGWAVNALAWVLFILASNHAIEIIMGLACIFAFYVGFKHKNNRLIYSSVFDTLWMFAWGLGFFDGAFF